MQGAGFGFFHDIAMSENYYIALENPISMDFSTLLLRYMTGRACLAECLKYDPNKRTKIHLIPRPGRPGCVPQKEYIEISKPVSQATWKTCLAPSRLSLFPQ